MRSILALPALIAVITAQSFPTTRPISSADNVQPTSTVSSSGPIETSKACGAIAKLVRRSSLQNPSIDAELAYACLKSVPINQSAASQTITSLKQMLQFQSTLSYLKNPPSSWPNEKVDLVAGLDDIGKKVSDGTYDNEYDFENDISALLVKGHDGHLSFGGMAFGGVFRWRRNRQVALISGSSDGKEVPKVWVMNDYNQTGSGNTPSAVQSIDGQDAAQFLEKESLLNSYHDPDARYNSMFYMQPAENYGYFVNPRFYPGPKVNITYENGNSSVLPNTAIILSPNSWQSISDASDFYTKFITPSTDSKKIKKRDPHSLPQHLRNPREAELDRRYVPAGYPIKVVSHSSDDVTLAGFFVDGPDSKVGVLIVQTFNTETADDAREFQAVVQNYIAAAQEKNVTKHIIDVRTNGGGKVLLGYDTYLQFFPSKEPQLMSRYRGHQGSELLGEKLSSIPRITNSNGELYTSPFNFHSYLNKDLTTFSSWSNMYPPSKFNGDSFTDLLRYNLSDPSTTSSERYSIGVEMTGRGTRSNFTQDPFKAEDIIILSDGICASTCSLFTELMVQESGVKALAVGGRPATGPMQAVGGTKGSLVLQDSYLTAVSSYIISNYATSNTEASQWKAFLPQEFAIANTDASVNFQDTIRKGVEKDGVPIQFLNDTASCRIYYEPNMYLNVTALWTKAANVAFGKNGGLDHEACVSGSWTTKEQQSGQGTPTSGGGASTSATSTTKAAAAGVVRPARRGWLAVFVCAGVVVGSLAFGGVFA
ncbi:peptidase S41 family protein-like protein [Massarina eburnea CBS 473.64]|uniref:Peptidase S41 family protein-like protein n=1 Tax=Massarina eburnea CBS 473.64 TaxID=1395130 RepID=A0A6A6SFS0_9PLEO|nr:peptidase S41 family protein-like protein [Massarina eburnea CBS 473.64]